MPPAVSGNVGSGVPAAPPALVVDDAVDGVAVWPPDATDALATPTKTTTAAVRAAVAVRKFNMIGLVKHQFARHVRFPPTAVNAALGPPIERVTVCRPRPRARGGRALRVRRPAWIPSSVAHICPPSPKVQR